MSILTCSHTGIRTDSQRERHTHTTKHIHETNRDKHIEKLRDTDIFTETDNIERHTSSNMDTYNKQRHRKTHLKTNGDTGKHKWALLQKDTPF